MSLTQTIITIDGLEFMQSRSDAGFKIEQTDTGIVYDAAIDPADNPLGHTYAETEEPIDSEDIYSELGKILFGEED